MNKLLIFDATLAGMESPQDRAAVVQAVLAREVDDRFAEAEAHVWGQYQERHQTVEDKFAERWEQLIARYMEE